MNEETEKEGLIKFLNDLIETIKTDNIVHGSAQAKIEFGIEENDITRLGYKSFKYADPKSKTVEIKWKVA